MFPMKLENVTARYCTFGGVVTSFIFDASHLLTKMCQFTGSTIYTGISKNGRMARGLQEVF